MFLDRALAASRGVLDGESRGFVLGLRRVSIGEGLANRPASLSRRPGHYIFEGAVHTLP